MDNSFSGKVVTRNLIHPSVLPETVPLRDLQKNKITLTGHNLQNY